MTTIRVRFAETDQMGIAHHGAYAAWLEVGRIEWLRERGHAYADLEASGTSLAVATLAVRYHRSARFDDLVEVETRVRAAGSRGCTFAYRLVRRPDGTLLATATTSHVAVDRSGRVQRLPAPLQALLRSHVTHGDDEGRC